MRAGRLRNVITIQSRTVSQDGIGAATESWTDVATVRATVTSPGGVERFVAQGDRQVATVTHMVRMRYRSDVSPLDRILYGSRVLDIQSAEDPDGRQRQLVVYCTERLGE